ncbi:protein spaetzle 4 [Nephila pilipes]|uniref:Protein spaetzle 4 n=1 Tax=Nephila pilipes TaxID=299642 RepID=A0A8X6NAF5_NEPPI|nr:protein spaetzle 4 [Nephila pilipes]
MVCFGKAIASPYRSGEIGLGVKVLESTQTAFDPDGTHVSSTGSCTSFVGLIHTFVDVDMVPKRMVADRDSIAYFESSVKRYINDNQGLVRRMYGDEKHSSVLLNEIDGFQMRFDMLRNSFDGFRSRTVYGRSARGHKPTRRQPRPQIFPDDEEIQESTSSTPGEPATIFRVVTETSIKVGEAITKSMSNPETTVSYEPASAFDSYTSSSTVATSDSTTPTTTEDALTTASTTESTYYQTPSTTETLYTTETNIPTFSSDYTTTDATTPNSEDVPVAMQRVGYEEFEEYEYEPRRKMDSAAMQNSVEEKIKYKEEFESDIKRTDPSKIDMLLPVDDLIAEESAEDVREENAATTSAAEETTKEEVPRRGM